MPKIINDKQMKKRNELLFTGNTVTCKWIDNWAVLPLSSALEGKNDIFPIQRREMGSKTKFLVPCPKVVKFYDSSMSGVDLMDERTVSYRLDRKSSVKFYLGIFFDLMEIACVNVTSFIT